MVMIIIHIAYIAILVTNDAWHAYDVIGVGLKDTSWNWSDLIFRENGNTVIDWYGHGRDRGP